MSFLKGLSMGYIIPLFSISLFFQLPLFSTEEQLYSTCAETFDCGHVTSIGYPFRSILKPPNCGYPNLVLSCENETTKIEINRVKYRVLSINPQAKTMNLVREDLVNSSCPQVLISTSFDNTDFELNSSYINLTFFYGCDLPVPIQDFPTVDFCHVAGYKTVNLFTGENFLVNCGVPVTVPVTDWDFTSNLMDLGDAFQRGFEVKWTVDDEACDECVESNGQCGFDGFRGKSVCFCPDPPYVSLTTCSKVDGAPSTVTEESGRKKTSKQLIIGTANSRLLVAGTVACFLVLGFTIFACRKRRNQIVAKSAEFGESKTEDIPFAHLTKSLTATTSSTSLSHSTPFSSSKYDTGKSSSYFGAKVFNYSELEEATNNFNPSREIGDGGFGMVFYGKLDDGREVAVKLLYENNLKRVRQFMNEVEILTRLSHINLVKLYGCTSRQSRELLLVYEYIPNGTVADHLHGQKAKSGFPSWPIRLNIAIETAEALAYLHKSDIIHRDVKTTNILLENDFQVKVADFGLSRLFPKDVTHVSTAPQGTPGYVDPEYHQCYHLTEKSDVYSFGVVLVELISSKQAVDITRNKHDINLATLAVNKIQNGELHELVDLSLGFEMNSSIRRMVTAVAEIAFRCLQSERDMRPSMEELLESLKRIKNNENLNGGRIEAMDIVIGDEAVLLKNRSPPISPNSVIADKWISRDTTPNTSG